MRIESKFLKLRATRITLHLKYWQF